MTLANYTFFYVIKAEDLAKLIQLTKVTIKSTQNPELINQLKSKLVLLKNEYRLKQQGNNVQVNFIGFYTYDVRVIITEILIYTKYFIASTKICCRVCY